MASIRASSKWAALIFLLACGLTRSSMLADDAASTKTLLDPSALTQVKPSDGNVTVEPGLTIKVQPSERNYPGIIVKPDGVAAWDLSAFGHIEAQCENASDHPISVNMRVDDGKLTVAEPMHLKAGAQGTLKVYFNTSFGHETDPINSAAVTQMLIFTGKTKTPTEFKVTSLVAAGKPGEKPPVNPDYVQVVPRDGIIIGPSVAIDLPKQTMLRGVPAANVTAADQGGVAITFPGKAQSSVSIRPAIGRWNLNQWLQVRVKIQNAGDSPIAPAVRLESNAGPTPAVSATAPIAPGGTAEIIVPFGGATELSGDLGHTVDGPRFASNTTAGVTILPGSDQPAKLIVQSARAEMPATNDIPDWLGKRPPVDGEWTQTLNENFDGSQFDESIWNVKGSNYWDKKSHISPAETSLKDGMAYLRFEKKAGHENDATTGAQSDYAMGYLDTFNKWVQRYGYFEARMKLPGASGMWPAFWMMPDRCIPDVPQWKESSTADGGMEFDILEYLSRWGPNRYNIAMHWDGYGKLHKSTGNEHNYVQPDKDGFITAGLLWTPGEVTYFANGKQILHWKDERISTVASDIMFTIPSGGWDNDPINVKQLPAEFVIDYVRAWQRKDFASDVDGKKSLPPPKAP